MEQDNNWSGKFGDDYQARNRSNWKSVKNRARLFEEIFARMEQTCKAFPASVLEVGAGCGDNLRAIDMIYERTRSPVKLMGCDINAAARDAMKDVAANIMPVENIGSLPYDNLVADMVFTSGVLIHIEPSCLDDAMKEIHRVSKRWILAIEYFNAYPFEVEYRDRPGMMWKRDFGSDWLRLFPSMTIIGCGFAWKKTTGLDDITWWLFEKPQTVF